MSPPTATDPIYAELNRAVALARLVPGDPPTLDDPDMTEFLRDGPGQLQRMALTLSAVVTAHPQNDGTCACGEPAPCRTRRILATRLLRTRGKRPGTG